MKQPGSRARMVVSQSVWAPLFVVALHAVVGLAGEPWPGVWNPVLDALVGGAVIVQPALCGLWAAWSPHPLVWRISSGVVSVILLAVAAWIGCESGVSSLSNVGAAFVIAWGVAAWGRRRWGWQLLWRRLPREPSLDERRTAFRLKDLLIGTGIAAVLCALLRPSRASARLDWEGLLICSYATPSVMLVALLVIRGSYASWRGWLRALIACLASLAVCALCFWLDDELGMAILLSIAVVGAWVATIASAVLLRLAGYGVASRTPA